MKVTPRSEVEVRKVSKRDPVKPGWHPGRITEAVQKPSRKGNEMIELTVELSVDSETRTLLDWLTNNNLGAAKLRHAVIAVDSLAKYESGDISQAEFPGHDVDVKVVVEKSKFGSKSLIVDYAVAGTETKKAG